MRNHWSMDEETFKKNHPEKYRLWKLAFTINHGLEKGEKLNREEVKAAWPKIIDLIVHEYIKRFTGTTFTRQQYFGLYRYQMTFPDNDTLKLDFNQFYFNQIKRGIQYGNLNKFIPHSQHPIVGSRLLSYTACRHGNLFGLPEAYLFYPSA